jgi:hypothetical protein
MATQADVRRVLVRLPAVSARELTPIIAEAWRCQAPKDSTPGRRRHAKRPRP